jgi:hypothetical protein
MISLALVPFTSEALLAAARELRGQTGGFNSWSLDGDLDEFMAASLAARVPPDHDFHTGRHAAGLFCCDAFKASRRATTMNVLGELQAVAAKLSPYDDRPTCECCGQGKLDLIDERPDPIFAVLGMARQTLKCDFLECGKLTII